MSSVTEIQQEKALNQNGNTATSEIAPPRVLFLETLPFVSGGQKVLVELVPALAGFSLSALLPGPGPLAEALTEAGMDCHFVPMASYNMVGKNLLDLVRFPLDQLRLFWCCYGLIKRLEIDLVYANTSRAFVWGTAAAILAARPIIWHLHNLLGDTKTIALVRYMGKRQAVRRIIAVSQVAADQFPELGHKIRTIPNGVDTQLFHPDRLARLAVRQEYGIGAHEAAVGIVGDLIPLKGQHTLLEAARLVTYPARYIVVGEARGSDRQSAAYAQSLRKMAGQNVIFAGRTESLQTLLNALDLLVIASERETGPLVLSEAMACGLPVLSTPVGRAPELLGRDQLFAIGDAVDLARLIQSWLGDGKRLAVVGAQARRIAEQALGVDQFRLRIREQIGDVLAGQRAPRGGNL